MRHILIDLEFTGLDNTFIQDNEIIQLKLMDDDTGEGTCINFKANKPVSVYHRVYCRLTGNYRGRTQFSAKQFAKALERVGVKPDDDRQYFGYSVSTDIAMLKKYNVAVQIIDLQEKIRLNPQYEHDLAVGSASMECAYYLLTGKRPPLNTHLALAELDLVREVYQLVTRFTGCNELLTLMPYGHCAGMPISEYIRTYRRAADGYRFNNSDLLAKSLTARIPVYVPHDDEWDDDNWPGDDFDDED